MRLNIYQDYALRTSIELPGYTRGLCIGKSHLYVGISISRNIDPDLHQHLLGQVIVIDKQTLAPLGAAPVPFREIYDIQLVQQQADLMAVVNYGQANHQARILELTETLDQRESAIAQLTTGIAQYEASNTYLQTEIDKIHTSIKEYEASIKEYEASIKEYEASNTYLQAEIDKIHTSLSWRAGRPIRYLETKFKPSSESKN